MEKRREFVASTSNHVERGRRSTCNFQGPDALVTAHATPARQVVATRGWEYCLND
jgi:hypothetical protein